MSLMKPTASHAQLEPGRSVSDVSSSMLPRRGRFLFPTILLAASVLAGHSMGGLISRLFASRYGDEVAGLVLVDALSEDLYNGLSAEQRAVFERLNGAPERYDNIASFEQIRAAAPVRPMPVVVLTAGRQPITTEDIASGRFPPEVTAD